jgi:hypothetical protein
MLVQRFLPETNPCLQKGNEIKIFVIRNAPVEFHVKVESTGASFFDHTGSKTHHQVLCIVD